MIKIDIDLTPNKREFNDQWLKLQMLLHQIKPCFIRISSSKKGLHILKFYDDTKLYDDEKLYTYEKEIKSQVWVEEVYDDRKRLLINQIRARYGLTKDILFKRKSFRNKTRDAGDWIATNDSHDVEITLDYWRV